MRLFFVAVLAVCGLFAGLVVAGEGHKHAHKLGRQQIGEYVVSVIIRGEIEAGATAEFDIKLYEGTGEPKALRVWVGAEDAAGSTKAEGKKGKTTYVGTVTAPNPLPADAKVWVELETNSGTHKAGYAMDKHDHKH